MEGHVHCLSCINLRCMVRPEPGLSCDLVSCPLICGAVFHSCKSDEHQLLCPMMRVPCLNSDYGCPATMMRNQISAHLDVCPAGLVCCTMEWNRWPVSSLDYTSYESLSRVVEEVEQLDMQLALQDQHTLLESLKVIAMAPSVQEERLVPFSKENEPHHLALQPPASKISAYMRPSSEPPSSHPSQSSMRDSAKEKIIRGINGLNEEHFSKLYQATAETARSLVAALDFVSGASCGESSSDCLNIGDAFIKTDLSNNEGLATEVADSFYQRNVEEESGCLNRNGAVEGADKKVTNTLNGPMPGAFYASLETTKDGNADISQEKMVSPVHVSPGVAQIADYVVLDDGEGVLSENHWPERRFHDQYFAIDSQLSLPNNKTVLMAGQLSYKLPAKMEDKAVDTSDLEQGDDTMGLGEIDLITAALLFCLEESRECRRISDTVYVDCYRVDFGTQTFTFPAAILVTNTRVGDMASASACDHAASQLTYPSPFHTLRLGLVLEALKAEAVPYNRYLTSNPHYQHTFPFICGQSFRRDQFSSHFRNVHGDIHAGLNGWMEHRCPLAYYGCTFSQRRFYPTTLGAKVVHDRHLKSFSVQPCPELELPSETQLDNFSRLPMEILLHIAGFLDSFSLCQLSLVSRTMREVCASLLQTRGIIELQWEQRLCPGGPGCPGTVSWQIKNKVNSKLILSYVGWLG